MLGLEVCQLPSGFLNIFDLRLKETQHDAPGLINSTVQVNGAENRLEGIHQQGLFRAAAGLLLASAQLQVVAQMDVLRIFDEIGGAHKKTFQLRKLSLRQIRMRPKEKIADKKPQYRVSEEFELLVVS